MSATQIMWDVGNVPRLEEEEFQALIHYKERNKFHPSPEQCHAWENAPNSKTYASFGDRGTTATVSAYGNIVQFDTFVGEGHSGMFSVDPEHVEEPYMVNDRTKTINNLAGTNATEGDEIAKLYGLRMPGLDFDEMPRQSWVNYRWPRYEFRDNTNKGERPPGKTNTIQWMVYDNIVLQHCTVKNLSDTELSFNLEFPGREHQKIRIRDLDHIDSQYRFNDKYRNYNTLLGLHGYSWVLTHKLEAARTNNDSESDEIVADSLSSIALVVSIFLNGTALDWDDAEQWRIKLSSVANTSGSTPGNVAKIVVAYKMILISSSQANWKDLLVPASYTDINELLAKEPQPEFSMTEIFEITQDMTEETIEKRQDNAGDRVSQKNKDTKRTSWWGRADITIPIAHPIGLPSKGQSSELHIEFLVRRNLEHILSTCSIPVARPKADQGTKEEFTPVALTCGPMSFHRIIASASYFAYQFLLEIAQRLRQSRVSKEKYTEWLLGRISSVCRGHLKWIQNAQKAEAGYLVANYWVTGKIIDQRSASWRPDDSLTDNPFHIIKLGNHATVFTEDKSMCATSLRTICIPWLRDLEKKDKRNCFAWPHAQESDINIFRLDDHVWIWKALKAIDKLGLWVDRSQVNSDDVSTGPTASSREDWRRWARIYGYRNVQREILRRFTTESEISRKRMLAVTRSPRETRFLLHARDTVLFYEFDDFLLPETSFRTVWENTIEAQKHHDENQETRWDNALRYALTIIMGTDGYAINKEKSPTKLVEDSFNMLLKSSSQNGIFSGQLDETMKEPVLFYREADRDFYFHAGFEISFIVLIRATELRNRNKPSEYQGNAAQSDIAEFSERLTTQPKRQQIAGEISMFADNGSNPQTNALAKITQVAQQGQSMKKTMPFNRFIDSNSIVEIPEEWLYNYPYFLSNDKSLSRKDVDVQLATHLVETRVSRTITDLSHQDPNFAVSVIENDHEIRKRLCSNLAVEAELCIKILGDKDNEDLRKIFAESVGHDHHQVIQDFLTKGQIPQLPNIHNGSGAPNSVSALSLASTVSTASGNLTPEHMIREFLRGEDVVLKLENVFRECRDALYRNIRNFPQVRDEIRYLVSGETDRIVRILLHNKVLHNMIQELPDFNEGLQGHVILQAARQYLDATFNSAVPIPEHDPWYLNAMEDTAAVVDTKKKTTQGKRGKRDDDWDPTAMSNLALWLEYLNMPRTAATAKKRLIFLPVANTQTALICFLGSPENERSSVSLFFDRHQNSDLYFFDDTTMSQNTWETEFHLSFYQLVSPDQHIAKGCIPPVRSDMLPGGKGSMITKASIGFRFFGDFFDRYWTCHLVEFIPAKSIEKRWDFLKQFTAGDRAWRQRKILELSIFDRILGTVVESTREIIGKLKTELGVRHGAFSFVNLQSDDYFSSSDHWQESQQTLQAIEDHLEHIMTIIAKWETREKDRGLERPRWTRNDEWKYRGDLKKLLVSNTSKVKDLKSLHTEIKTLKEYLMSRQDQIRNDLSLRGAENIRFFTYVTVVFLPLGFAASIFSMSETPDGLLIGHMAGTAAVALVLTVVALINAEKLGILAEVISHTIAQHSNSQMRQSQLLQRYRESQLEPLEPHEPSHDDTTVFNRTMQSTNRGTQNVSGRTRNDSQKGRSKDKNSWHPWFWLMYVLVELPARRAASAYHAMKEHQPTLSALLRVISGILVLPWSIIIWLIQLVIVNMYDLLHVINDLLKPNKPSSSVPPQENIFRGNIALLLWPHEALRPFLRIDMNRRKKKQDENNQRRERVDMNGKTPAPTRA